MLSVAATTVPSGSFNYLFRTNMPVNATSFAYDALMADVRKRAAEAGSGYAHFPASNADVHMLDISLDNPFDSKDDNAKERGFWADPAHAALGEYLDWSIGFAGILPPSIYTAAEIASMSAADGEVWKKDQLPLRLQTVRSLLYAPHSSGKTLLIIVHCQAGCDRTGEFVGSYRMLYEGSNVTDMYARDVTECTRPPNYFSTSALEWFCYYLSLHQGMAPGNCTGFATCEPFGKCKPTMAI